MNRRQWAGLGLAGLVSAAGGAALWQARQPRWAPDPVGLWGMSFPRPDGGELALAAQRGQALVLNFWATWCPPCVEEMPELDAFHRGHAARGWQVVGLAVDGLLPVREFLKKTPVAYPIALAGFGGTDLSRRLGNERGALPFTVVFDRLGHVLQRRLGRVHLHELQAWAA